MNLLFVLFVVICSASGEEGLSFEDDPITLDGPIWEKVLTTSRSLTTPSSPGTNLRSPLESDTYSEFSSHSALKEFLDNYAEKIRHKVDKNNNISELNEEKDRKSWNLLGVQHHHYPIDDKKGWVSLDPIPWSVSKVQKWKPTESEKPLNSYSDRWDDAVGETQQEFVYKKPEPQIEINRYQYINNNKPNLHSKPYPLTGQSVQTNYHKTPIHITNYHTPEEDCNHRKDSIITDGEPPNFPNRHFGHHYGHHRSNSDLHPKTHPFLGKGDWVLLSASKGYKSPPRGQRSLDINPEVLNTRKGVKLTVLPPAKNSKVNMTTSHGGLLQVESSFETVDEALKKHQKSQTKTKRRKNSNKRNKTKKKVREITKSAIAAIPRNIKNTDSNAVLAGVGAGIIPATMAMLVPLAMNGRKRRKRNAFKTLDSESLEITLPHYL